MNNGTWIVNLGSKPEKLTLQRDGGTVNLYRLRCAEKCPGKKSITRWFSALVSGQDMEVAAKLETGDTLAVIGQMALTEYEGKNGKTREDEITFAKILNVIRSPTFFAGLERKGGTEAPTFDPLAGL
jgi:single-stranded DNA-binding protein